MSGFRVVGYELRVLLPFSPNITDHKVLLAPDF